MTETTTVGSAVAAGPPGARDTGRQLRAVDGGGETTHDPSTTGRQRGAVAKLKRQLQAASETTQTAVAARLEAERALVALRDSVESEVLERTQALSETVRLLDSFNQMVAHDLREPLTSVSGVIDMIKRKLDAGDTAQIPRWLEMAGAQTRHLTAMVAALHELSQLARPALHWQVVPVESLAWAAVETVRASAAVADAPPIDFHVAAMPTLAVDPLLLQQVFVNLIGNAAKFCRGATAPAVQVSAELAGPQAVVCVADNGVGFDKAHAARLFQPFVRLHEKSFEGTGIGLTIVKRIVEMHGGKAWAESSPGQGARFRFSLPMAGAPAQGTTA